MSSNCLSIHPQFHFLKAAVELQLIFVIIIIIIIIVVVGGGLCDN